MNTPDRPGIHERWLKNARASGKHRSAYSAQAVEKTVSDLRYYVAHGLTQAHTSALAKEFAQYHSPKMPPEKGWEAFVPETLMVYGHMKLCEWEATGVNARLWDAGPAQSAFQAVRLATLMSLYTHMMFPQRFAGRVLQRMHYSLLGFTALGLVGGCDEEALRLARVNLAAMRMTFYDESSKFPMSCFVARLLADHLGQSIEAIRCDRVHMRKSEVRTDTVMDGLFNAWRDPDPAVLRPHLLAVCDVHTHHAFTGANAFQREFSNGMWTRVPIAALLVFKLRAMRGLANPDIEHPLMETVLGTLPRASSAVVPDFLVESVKARMMQDGYDEQEIVDHYLGQRAAAAP